MRFPGHIALIVLVALFTLISVESRAQLPEPKRIPAGLPDQPTQQLRARRAMLEARRQSLENAIRQHDQECSRVPAEDVSRVEMCRSRGDQLQGEARRYLQAVVDFNRAVELAEASAKLIRLVDAARSEITPYGYALLDEIETLLGPIFARSFEREIEIVGDAQTNLYMQRLLQRLAVQWARPGFRYTVKIVKCGEINALQRLGQIYVYSGLVEALNEAEFAAVLAHELSHVEARHSLEALLRILQDLIASVAPGELSMRLVRRMERDEVQLSHEEEFEADRLAQEKLNRAGDGLSSGWVSYFEKGRQGLRRKADASGRCPQVSLPPHPSWEERLQKIGPLVKDPVGHIDSPDFRNFQRRLREIVRSP